MITGEFHADRLPRAERLDAERQLIADNALVPIDVRLEHGPEVASRMVAGELGDVQVLEWRTGAREVRRTARHIRRSDPELFQIEVAGPGEVCVEQGGRQARLGTGDLAFLNLSRPATWQHRARRFVLATFPRTLLPLPPDELERLTAVRIPGDQGAGALASALLLQLPRYLDRAASTSHTRVGSALVDLVGVALAERLDRLDAVPEDGRGRVLLARIHAHIERHLGDPTLTPASIAAAHHISVRYLHKLFDGSDTGPAGWIRRRRLERCRADLLDPANWNRPVAAVAAGRGFTNPAHFSRLFRETYGLPPGEFRNLYAAR